MRINARYTTRSIRLLELWDAGDWRIKVYGLTPEETGPVESLVGAAKALASDVLPLPAETSTRYGVGFMGVHQGRGSNLVFVDWWANENELFHRAFTSRPADPLRFRDATPAGLAACVWDLAVIAFERDAWVRLVLSPPHPDVDRYLATHLAGWI